MVLRGIFEKLVGDQDHLHSQESHGSGYRSIFKIEHFEQKNFRK